MDATIQTIAAKIDKLAMRQELIITALDDMTSAVQALAEQVGEVVEWTQEKPDNSLSDALRQIGAALNSLTTAVIAAPQQTADLVAAGR
jgi:hypothetical protein